MIDPRTQYILYKERENELMRRINRTLAAQEQPERTAPSQPWYTKPGQWVKEKVLPDLRSIALARYLNR